MNGISCECKLDTVWKGDWFLVPKKVFGKGGIKVEPASRLTTVGHGQEM